MAGEVTEPTTQREAGDARVRDKALHCGQAVDLSLAVQVAQQATGLGAGGAGGWVHPHSPHERQVEHQSVVTRGQAGNVVTTALDGQREALLAGEVDARHDIGHAKAACDQGGSLVDHRVPQGARVIVAGFARKQERTPQAGSERVESVTV